MTKPTKITADSFSFENAPVSDNDLRSTLNIVINAGLQLSSCRDLPNLFRSCEYYTNQILGTETATILIYDSDEKVLPDEYAQVIKKAIAQNQTVAINCNSGEDGGTLTRVQIASVVTCDETVEAVLYMTSDGTGLLNNKDEIRAVDYLVGTTSSMLSHIKSRNCATGIGSESNRRSLDQQTDKGLIEQLKFYLNTAKAERERAELANSQKSHFLAQVSHEVRSSIGCILGFSEVALRESLSESELQRTFETINRSANYLLKLTNNLLDHSKIENEMISVETITFDPIRIANDVMESFRHQVESKPVDLSINFGNDVPRKLKSDPTIFRQMLTNLVGNAVKFTNSGEVSLTIESDSFHQIDGKPTSCLTLIVKDSGIGMTQRQLRRIFSPYRQAEESIRRRFGGTGLGLSITKKLIEILGGTIEVSSKPNRGSQFTVVLNIEVENGTDCAEFIDSRNTIANEKTPNPIQQLQHVSIFIAEDVQTDREFLNLLLNQTGANLSFFENGLQVIDSINNGDKCDLILMDMHMPTMSGADATKRLRKNGFKKPIIALTDNPTDEDVQLCLKSGCTDFITKPVDIDELMKKLSIITRSRKSPAPDTNALKSHHEERQKI